MRLPPSLQCKTAAVWPGLMTLQQRMHVSLLVPAKAFMEQLWHAAGFFADLRSPPDVRNLQSKKPQVWADAGTAVTSKATSEMLTAMEPSAAQQASAVQQIALGLLLRPGSELVLGRAVTTKCLQAQQSPPRRRQTCWLPWSPVLPSRPWQMSLDAGGL